MSPLLFLTVLTRWLESYQEKENINFFVNPQYVLNNAKLQLKCFLFPFHHLMLRFFLVLHFWGKGKYYIPVQSLEHRDTTLYRLFKIAQFINILSVRFVYQDITRTGEQIELNIENYFFIGTQILSKAICENLARVKCRRSHQKQHI